MLHKLWNDNDDNGDDDNIMNMFKMFTNKKQGKCTVFQYIFVLGHKRAETSSSNRTR